MTFRHEARGNIAPRRSRARQSRFGHSRDNFRIFSCFVLPLALYTALALAASGCQALHHIAPDHDLQANVRTPVRSLSVRLLWGEPGALPPAAMDPRRSLGLGVVPTITIKF